MLRKWRAVVLSRLFCFGAKGKAMTTRDTRITIRLTTAERARVERAAVASDVKLSAVIRRALRIGLQLEGVDLR
jgi:hypothetical protein